MRNPKNSRLTFGPSALMLACGLLVGAAGCGDTIERVTIVCDGGPLRDQVVDAGTRDSGIDSGVRDAGTDAAIVDAGNAPVTDAAVSDGAVTDAGVLQVPFPTTGMRIEAANGVWTYVPFGDTQCRDGTNAALAVNLNNASKKVMIVLEGGGACFDAASCRQNAANLGSQQRQLGAGVFDRGNLANPVRDWNYVYVPYCTGDTHAGTNAAAMVPGVPGLQRFVGHLNMQRFLQRVVPTFRDATDVVLTGVSAGGFGAVSNALLVQRAFGNQLKVKLVNDSAPALSAAVVPECLQQKFRTLWGLDRSLLADCGTACPRQDDYSQSYALFVAQTLGDRPTGLISSTRDGVLSAYYGGGRNNCSGTTLQDSVPSNEFQQDLFLFRERSRVTPNFGTFFVDGTAHGWIYKPEFYTQGVGEVKIVDWFARIVNSQAPGHVGP